MKKERKNTFTEKVMPNVKFLSGEKIIVACSGGPDSMVALDILMKQKDVFIIVAHVHHGLRKTADRDEKIVQKYCQENNLTLEVLHADIMKESKKTKTTIEECARSIRREWLEKMRKKHHADMIVTAHHADDQTETLFYRITKGTSITGLIGIEEHVGHYFRPLLQSTKSEILAYAKDHHITFGHDETNDDITIPRNLLRHEVIPKLQKINPEIASALGRLSTSAQELKIGFDDFFGKIIEQGYFDINWFHELPRGFQHELFRFLYEQTNTSTHGLSRAIIEELGRFLSTRNGGKKEIKKMKLQKKQGKVFISKK